jgi:hypothetical protein
VTARVVAVDVVFFIVLLVRVREEGEVLGAKKEYAPFLLLRMLLLPLLLLLSKSHDEEHEEEEEEEDVDEKSNREEFI